MIRLLYSIYLHSYDALEEYGKNQGFENWALSRKKIIYSTNTLLFGWLQQHVSTGNAEEKAFRQQFSIDVVNGVLKKHYRARQQLYRKINILPFGRRNAFALAALLLSYWRAFTDIGISLIRCRHVFLPDISTGTGVVNVCIGFPEHAFSYQPNKKAYPKSFAEYLLIQGLHQENGQKLVSIDEYVRPSKKFETGSAAAAPADAPATLNRIRIQPQIQVSGWISGIQQFFRLLSAYKSRYGFKGVLSLAEFAGQSYTGERLKAVLEAIKKNGMQIRSVYQMVYMETGLLKYDKKTLPLIQVFSYAQNAFMPPSAAVMKNMFNKTGFFQAEEILEENDTHTFSFFYQGICGFTYHAFLINFFRQYVNSRFGLSLPVHTIQDAGTMPVNLGYESVYSMPEQLNPVKTILVFDVPLETPEAVLRNTIMGDRSAMQDFITAFHHDIAWAARQLGWQIYLKPKYSLASPALPDSYKQLVQGLRDEPGNRFTVLDPYCTVQVSEQPIDLMINFPFTSTFYSMADVCRRAVYYVPDGFTEGFSEGVEDKLIQGRSALLHSMKQLSSIN
jgi:hypothetical protein